MASSSGSEAPSKRKISTTSASDGLTRCWQRPHTSPGGSAATWNSPVNPRASRRAIASVTVSSSPVMAFGRLSDTGPAGGATDRIPDLFTGNLPGAPVLWRADDRRNGTAGRPAPQSTARATMSGRHRRLSPIPPAGSSLRFRAHRPFMTAFYVQRPRRRRGVGHHDRIRRSAMSRAVVTGSPERARAVAGVLRAEGFEIVADAPASIAEVVIGSPERSVDCYVQLSVESGAGLSPARDVMERIEAVAA